jgi:hypothetical protein
MVPLGTHRKCAGAGLHYLRTILGVEQPNYPEMVRQQSLADGLCSPAAPAPSADGLVCRCVRSPMEQRAPHPPRTHAVGAADEALL